MSELNFGSLSERYVTALEGDIHNIGKSEPVIEPISLPFHHNIEQKAARSLTHESSTPSPDLEHVLSNPTSNLRPDQKTAPVKKPPNAKKWRWKKPKGRPKRPLSAYNIFFQHERQSLRDSRVQAYAESSDKTLGFAGLAKHVSIKWKTLDDRSKLIYEELAAVEKHKYFISLDQWKKDKDTQETIMVAEEPKILKKMTGKGNETTSTNALVDNLSVGAQLQAQNQSDADYSNDTDIQNQRDILMAQLVYQQMSMPLAMGDQYSMAAAMQDQAAMMVLQNPYLSAYSRSMSMPMGTMEAPTRTYPIDSKAQRSMSMPMGAHWSSNQASPLSGIENVEQDVEQALNQSDTATALLNLPSRRMSMPMTGTEERQGANLRFARRSVSMPLVNMDYINSVARKNSNEVQEYFDSQEHSGGYNVNNMVNHDMRVEYEASHPDGVIISRRLSMPAATTSGASAAAVATQRRSSSMPMVNMEYGTAHSIPSQYEDITGSREHLLTEQREASNHSDAEMRDGIIYSRRMSMPAAIPNANASQQKHGVTASRRSMSMPPVKLERNKHIQHNGQGRVSSQGGDAMDMDDEFDDLLSQLRGSD